MCLVCSSARYWLDPLGLKDCSFLEAIGLLYFPKVFWGFWVECCWNPWDNDIELPLFDVRPFRETLGKDVFVLGFFEPGDDLLAVECQDYSPCARFEDCVYPCIFGFVKPSCDPAPGDSVGPG